MEGYEIIAVVAGSLGLILMLIFLFTLYPGKRRSELLRSIGGWDYAHRGLHNTSAGIYENTLPAFRHAADNGYGTELDVQLTADNIPVVFHDFDLKRMCGVDKMVSELKYEELSRYKIMDSDAVIPLFAEVLQIFEGRAPMIVEIKLAGKDTKACEHIDALLSGYKGDYCIESFNPRVVHWYKHNRPGVIRGQLSSDFFKESANGKPLIKFIMKNLMTNFLTKPDFVAYNHIFSNGLALRIYRKLYKGFTVAWTVETPEKHEIAKQKFDLVIFENYLP